MAYDPHDPFAELFDGVTYDPERDGARLLRQSQAVRAVLLSSRAWMSTPEIKSAIGAEAHLAMDVTARIRDLRKAKHGDHSIESRPRGGKNGLWEYRHSPSCQCVGGDQHGEARTPPVWFDAIACDHPRHSELMAWVKGLLQRGKCPKSPEASSDELADILDRSC